MKSALARVEVAAALSRPARGAWIEIESMRAIGFDAAVAPREGRVD